MRTNSWSLKALEPGTMPCSQHFFQHKACFCDFQFVCDYVSLWYKHFYKIKVCVCCMCVCIGIIVHGTKFKRCERINRKRKSPSTTPAASSFSQRQPYFQFLVCSSRTMLCLCKCVYRLIFPCANDNTPYTIEPVTCFYHLALNFGGYRYRAASFFSAPVSVRLE